MVTQILLESGADPNLKVYNDEDATQLRPALAEYLASNTEPSAEIITMLLRYGARVGIIIQWEPLGASTAYGPGGFNYPPSAEYLTSNA